MKEHAPKTSHPYPIILYTQTMLTTLNEIQAAAPPIQGSGKAWVYKSWNCSAVMIPLANQFARWMRVYTAGGRLLGTGAG